MRKHEKGFVGVFDIDGTLLRANPTPREIIAANCVRRFVSSRGAFTVATAQTAEMIMSSKAYAASVARGFKRRRPMLGRQEDGTRYYRAPETMPERHAFTDPDLIMSLGTGVHFPVADYAYLVDRVFENSLGGESWREAALRMERYATESEASYYPNEEDRLDFRDYLSTIESIENYEAGVTDVMPLEYRLQFEFKDGTPQENLLKKERAKSALRRTAEGLEYLSKLKGAGIEHTEIIRAFGAILGNFEIQDESSQDLSRCLFYGTPRLASKEHMVNRGLSRLAGDDEIDDLLIAGDMPPDLRAGCFSGKATRATFLLVGGSPLSPFLRPGVNDRSKLYAGESFEWLLSRLVATDRPGFGAFRTDDGSFRRVIIGDMAYEGTKGPETIRAYLEDEYRTSLQ